MTWLFEQFIRHPKLFQIVGRATYSLGGLLLAAGWLTRRIFGRLVRVQAKAPTAEIPTSLATLYPTLPTWWIPESTVGFTIAVALMIFGAVLAFSAKRIIKLMR